jgi:sterol desaturase/sphingolipid hydroxylase (fatty acid hydroxylase superfamily)
LQQVTGVFFKTIIIIGYIFLYEHYRIFEIKDNFLTYFLLFVGIDFFYYWFHRYAHEVSLFWGTHIVHHQSEEYNFSVALRQSVFQSFISMIFYLPLALVGFNPIAFVTLSAFQTLYQFWIHTKLIDKMHPAFEYIFNTPSHHRVHHGRNPEYIDKNHGGTLIIFDRMFGTFQPEEAEVVYGVTKPLSSWNPIWANLDWYADLWADLKRPMAFSDKIKLLFKKPGWLPASEGGYRAPQPIVGPYEKFDTSVSPQLNYYVLLQYAILLAVTSYFLFNLNAFNRATQLALGGFVILSIVTFGGLLESKKWASLLEISRYIIVFLAVLFLYFVA